MSIETGTAICNICGGNRWRDMGSRKGVQCVQCGSLERTRALKIVLDELVPSRKGLKILHFAPELGLYLEFKADSPLGYDPVDYSPENFANLTVQKFDIVNDSEKLPSNHYDLIVHSHVLEHIPCNLAYFFFHAARALSPTGLHIFCFPIQPGHYDEFFGPLPIEERMRRYGQDDHVRRFGDADMSVTLGKLVRLKDSYSLYDYADKDILDLHNIPVPDRTGFNSSTIFASRKEDYLLSPL